MPSSAFSDTSVRFPRTRLQASLVLYSLTALPLEDEHDGAGVTASTFVMVYRKAGKGA